MFCLHFPTDGEPLRMETSDDVIIAEPKEDEVQERTSIYVPQRGSGGSGAARTILTVDFVKKYILYAKARWCVGWGWGWGGL